MSKFTRVVVLVVGLMTVFAAMAGAASATTWRNTGSTLFTATTGPGTLSAAGVSLSCTSGSATGTAPATEAGPNYTVTGTLNYPSCRLPPFLTTSVSCTYTLTGVPPVTSGVTAGSVLVNCRESAAGCTITGTVPGTYRNATGTTAGVLSVRGSTGLTSSGCILSGAASLTPDPNVFTVTAGLSPTGRGPILAQP